MRLQTIRGLDILFRIDLHKGTQNPRESNMEEQVIHSRDKQTLQELDLAGFKTDKKYFTSNQSEIS